VWKSLKIPVSGSLPFSDYNKQLQRKLKSVPFALGNKDKRFNWNSNKTVTEGEKEPRKSRSNREDRLKATQKKGSLQTVFIAGMQINEFPQTTHVWNKVLIRNYYIPLTQLTVSITATLNTFIFLLKSKITDTSLKWPNTVKKTAVFWEVGTRTLVKKNLTDVSEVLTASIRHIMEIARISKMSVNFYQTTRCNNRLSSSQSLLWEPEISENTAESSCRLRAPRKLLIYQTQCKF
jgi:hypothetical protein